MDGVIAVVLLVGLYFLGRQDGREAERRKEESPGAATLPYRFTWACPLCEASTQVSVSDIEAIPTAEALVAQIHAANCMGG